MNVSENWLREWVSPREDAKILAQRLTLAGLEVSALQPAAPGLAGVLVGRIEAVHPHPSAARLTLCRVNVGKRTLTIVCGAPNAAVGLKVPVALPGARLPDERRIERAAIQGVESDGMLCSAADLGLTDGSDGLLVLERDAPIGRLLSDHLALDDTILEIDLTPNRGDCMSVAGIAREVAALTGARLQPVSTKPVRVRTRDRREVRLRAPADGPRYTGRVIRDIQTDRTTPLWMRERLRRGGVRSIHPVVDVTNYVMLELGQPMHAFDLDTLHGDITVRYSTDEGEELTLLDGNRVPIPAGCVLIADQDRVLALAGVMGGADSAVSASTRHLFLESAFFRPHAVARSARFLDLQTESSQRFERGVDPELARAALERATALLIEIVGGTPGPVTEAVSKRHLPKTPTIVLRHARIERVLGIAVPQRQVETALKRLSMSTRKIAGGWRVQPPSYRFDLGIEVDLIEEIARLQGYQHVPGHLPQAPMSARPAPETRVPLARVRTLLSDREYQEVVTYSFVDPALQSLIDPAIPPLKLANPISADMAVMRTSLWPGLLRAILYNQNRQQTRLRFFEIGRRFIPGVQGLDQEPMLAGAVTGSVAAEQWGMPGRGVDFYDVKGDIEALAALRGLGATCRFSATRHPALHPGQTAAIHFGEDFVGWVGTLHPGIQAQLGLDQQVLLFELRLPALTAAQVPQFQEISRFPAIRRDIAVVVPEETPAQNVLACIKKVAGKLLVNLELFDEYRGERIDSGRKSLAMGLTLQDSSRTLKEAEIDDLMGRLIATLRADLGAQLRSGAHLEEQPQDENEHGVDQGRSG